MSLKKNIPPKDNGTRARARVAKPPKVQPITPEEFAALVQRRLSRLQSAKGCAAGLTEIHGFLEEELENCPNEDSPTHLHGGLYEIAELLRGCMVRETDGLELELWTFMRGAGITHDTTMSADVVRLAEAKVPPRRA